jgi:hypothetical protein
MSRHLPSGVEDENDRFSRLVPHISPMDPISCLGQTVKKNRQIRVGQSIPRRKIGATKMLRTTLVAAAIALSACASAPEIRTLSDPSLNMAQYRTFGFADPLGTDSQGYESLVSTQLKASTRREMEARGFTYVSENPDLLINFGANLADRLRVSQYAEPAMVAMPRGYYGFRGQFYQPWPQYTDRTEISQYREGTLTIDLIDAARKQLIWEGTVTKSVQASDDVMDLLDNAVNAAMAKLPAVPRP